MPITRGRLIKKGEGKIYKSLEIQEYPWLAFNEDQIAFTDNPRKSVISERFHDPDELAAKVKVPEEFRKNFSPRTTALFPVDLTADYITSQEELALMRRRQLLDEEELVSLELAGLESDGKHSSWRQKKLGGSGGGSNSGSGSQGGGQGGQAKDGGSSQASTVLREQAQGVTQGTTQGMTEGLAQETAPAISKMAPATREEPASDQQVVQHPQHFAQQAAAVVGAGGQKMPSAEVETPDAFIEDIKNKAWEESYTAGYTEGYNTGFAQGAGEAHSEGFSGGHREGFESGLREGEEKGSAAADSKSQRYFKILGETLSELETLRSNILAAGQEIFIEIAKLASERILRTQLKFSDDTLRNMFNNTVDAYGENDHISIEMHPDDARRLRQIHEVQNTSAGQTPRKVKIKENLQLEPGDFKLEANSEVVTGNIKRAVDTLVETLRRDLFADESQGTSQDSDQDTKQNSKRTKAG